jgi:SmpA / OmlA family
MNSIPLTPFNRSASTVMDRGYGKLLLSAAALSLSACSSAVSAHKIAQIKPNMTSDQVQAILGRPTRIEQTDPEQPQTGEVDYYTAPKGEGRVIYVNHTVFKAEFIAGATP